MYETLYSLKFKAKVVFGPNLMLVLTYLVSTIFCHIQVMYSIVCYQNMCFLLSVWWFWGQECPSMHTKTGS